MRNFGKIKPSRTDDIPLSFNDVGKSCQSREYLKWKIRLLTLFAKNKIIAKNSEFTVLYDTFYSTIPGREVICKYSTYRQVLSPEVIKLFPCSTQLSIKFQLLMKTKVLKNKNFSCCQPLRCCIYHAHKC